MTAVVSVAPRRRRLHTVAVRSRRSNSYLGRRVAGGPWRNVDLLRLGVLHVVSAVGITICWYQSGGEVSFRDQTIWTAWAALAVAVAVAGGASFLLTGLAAVARERRSLRTQIAAMYGARTTDAATQTGPVGAEYVTADGMRRYHHRSCDVVRGKTTRPARVLGPDAEDLRPCGMCRS